jgi:hypothetical protein
MSDDIPRDPGFEVEPSLQEVEDRDGMPQEAEIAFGGLERFYDEAGEDAVYAAVMDRPAEVVKSSRFGKAVEVFRLGEETLVRRVYGTEAARTIAPEGDFADKFAQFKRLTDAAGLPMVRHVVLGADSPQPVIVAEYADGSDGSIDVKDQPTEEKAALLGALGKALTASNEILPDPRIIESDSFGKLPGTSEIGLLDCDPYSISRELGRPLLALMKRGDLDNAINRYMVKTIFCIRDWADGNRDDQTAMAKAFVDNAKIIFWDDPGLIETEVLSSFIILHSMSLGMNPKMPNEYEDDVPNTGL